MKQETNYETGAQTHEVNNLLLFIQTTRELQEIDRKTVTAEQFINEVLKRYKREVKEEPPKLSNEQKRDLINNI